MSGRNICAPPISTSANLTILRPLPKHRFRRRRIFPPSGRKSSRPFCPGGFRCPGTGAVKPATSLSHAAFCPPAVSQPCAACNAAPSAALLETSIRRTRQFITSARTCSSARSLDAPPVAKIFSGDTCIHCECSRMDSICASKMARQLAAAFFSSRSKRWMPGRFTRGTISASNHGSRIAPSLPGLVLRDEFAEFFPVGNFVKFADFFAGQRAVFETDQASCSRRRASRRHGLRRSHRSGISPSCQKKCRWCRG